MRLKLRFINGSWYLCRGDNVQTLVSSRDSDTRLIGYRSIPRAMQAFKYLRSIGGIFV